MPRLRLSPFLRSFVENEPHHTSSAIIIIITHQTSNSN